MSGKVAIIDLNKDGDEYVRHRGVLPKAYKTAFFNSQNLQHIKDDWESLNEKRIYKLVEVVPDYDRETHVEDGFTEGLVGNEMIHTKLIREKTQGEIDAETIARAIAYSHNREGEYIREGITEKELTIALWERVVERRPETSDAIQKKRLAIKAKYPKP